MFYDNEDDIEGEQEEIESRSKRVDASKKSISELLIKGQIHAAIFQDEEQGRSAYNDNLRAYNGKYAQLVGKFHANEDGIEQILYSLPAIEDIGLIQKDIHEFRLHQEKFAEDFDNLKQLSQEISDEYLNMKTSTSVQN